MDYNRKVLTTVVLSLMMLIAIGGAIFASTIDHPMSPISAALFIAGFGFAANSLYLHYNRWQNNP